MFIVFEGIDGAGLSTQAKLLASYLETRGNVLLTKEPTTSEIGILIRKILQKRWNTSSDTLQLLFVADRAHHVYHVILPALKEGKIVVCDRYVLSTIAYGMLELEKIWLKNLNERFPLPNITFIIDVPPAISLNRIAKSRDECEHFETEQKLKIVREHFLELAKEYENCFIINGTKSIKDVHTDVKHIISKFINNMPQ